MAKQLFEDQEEFIDGIKAARLAGHKSILGVASPAFGKTVVAAAIAKSAYDKGNSCWFLVHRKNLLRQTSKSFWSDRIEHGLITSGKRASRLPIQVGTIGSVHSRIKRGDASMHVPAIMFVDEAHLSRGNMFTNVIEWALAGGCMVIGLTGTPVRLDGKALGDLFTTMVLAKPTSWLIKQGRLSEYEIYTTPMLPDLSDVKSNAGDYNTDQLAVAMGNSAILGDAVTHYADLAMGKRFVAYCVNVAHSKQSCAAFNAAGIPSVHVDADTTEAELKEACMGLATGKYLGLFNCELVIEGFDLSAQVDMDITLEVCILLRPTMSLARYLQMVFRAMRRKPYPAIILDHAGCVMRHGLPDDEREWSLEGKKSKKGADEKAPSTVQCEMCYHIFRRGFVACPKCNHPVPLKSRGELEVIEGKLEKVDVEAIRAERKIKRKEQGMAKGLRELVELGIRNGHKDPSGWAVNVHAARQCRKPMPAEYEQARMFKRDYESRMNKKKEFEF